MSDMVHSMDIRPQLHRTRNEKQFPGILQLLGTKYVFLNQLQAVAEGSWQNWSQRLCCTGSLLVVALVAIRLPRLPIVCTEDINLSANSC